MPTELKHTKLPWKQNRLSKEDIEICGSEYPVATIHHDPRDRHEMDANAQLICTAVNLYEALLAMEEAAKTVMACWHQGIPYYDGRAINAQASYLVAMSKLAQLREQQ